MSSKQVEEPVKYCPTCLKFNIHTAVERYHNRQLELCTYHYWLIRGRIGGHYTLEAYAEASRHNSFKTSLPSADEIAMMGGE